MTERACQHVLLAYLKDMLILLIEIRSKSLSGLCVRYRDGVKMCLSYLEAYHERLEGGVDLSKVKNRQIPTTLKQASHLELNIRTKIKN